MAPCRTEGADRDPVGLLEPVLTTYDIGGRLAGRQGEGAFRWSHHSNHGVVCTASRDTDPILGPAGSEERPDRSRRERIWWRGGPVSHPRRRRPLSLVDPLAWPHPLCDRQVHHNLAHDPNGENMPHPMGNDELTAFLTAELARTAALATVRPDGRPHVARIGSSWTRRRPAKSRRSVTSCSTVVGPR